MATAFCPFCGASLAGINAVYCPRCGKSLPQVDATPASQIAPEQAPVGGPSPVSAQPQPLAHSTTPSGGYQSPPAQSGPVPGAPSAAPQPYVAPGLVGVAVAQPYTVGPASPVTPGRAIGTTAGICAFALVFATVAAIALLDHRLPYAVAMLIASTAWALVAAFWLATRALARRSFGIVLLVNAGLCLVLLLLLPVLDLSVIAMFLWAVYGSPAGIQPLAWLLPLPLGKDIAILVFACIDALIATGLAAGFADWSRVRIATRKPVTGWLFVLPGLIVAGVFLLSDCIALWLLRLANALGDRFYTPQWIDLLIGLLLLVLPVVGLGILAGVLSYKALHRSLPALPPQSPPGTGSTP